MTHTSFLPGGIYNVVKGLCTALVEWVSSQVQKRKRPKTHGKGTG